jgi:hypothetical protein
MSKKLIAVASAAALAISLLAAVPASATAPTFTLGGGTGTEAGAVSTPRLVNVPSLNTIKLATDESAVSLLVDSLAIGDVVSITSTGAVKFVFTEVLAASANFNASNLGVQTYSTTKTNADPITVYAYSTSTTAGTIAATVTRPGLTSSQTYYVQGEAGLAYNIAATAGVPSVLSNTATSVVSFTVTDVFGNAVEARAAVSDDAQRVNMGLITWDAAAKVYKSTMTSPSTGAFIASIDLAAATRSITGMPDANQDLVATVNVSGAGTQVLSLTAQIAALEAKILTMRTFERSVTKKRFNTLARKWNAAFPSQAVKLKPPLVK